MKQKPETLMEHHVPFWKGLRTIEKGGKNSFIF